ncbi:MAG TPA: PPOX class F420-dependent oxidoreductase [Blastocatellia bacterium]|nr:PPOX class F420-dependent oxidoreductase [Blastocatellia bacterium]
MFTEKEIAYVKSQRLARIATVSENSQPDVAPVGFDFDGQYFYVGGMSMTRTLKYKNVQANPKVALVIDDLESVNPMRPRSLKIHGSGEIVIREGYAGAGPYIRIKPEVIWSIGINEPAFKDGKPIISKRKA